MIWQTGSLQKSLIMNLSIHKLRLEKKHVLYLLVSVILLIIIAGILRVTTQTTNLVTATTTN